jgi:hypothetical protein
MRERGMVVVSEVLEEDTVVANVNGAMKESEFGRFRKCL